MRKALSIFLVLMLCISLAACNGTTEPQEPGTDSPSSSSEVASGESDSDAGDVPSETADEGGEAAWDAYSPYPETVSFTKGVVNSPGMFPEGQTYEDNPYTNYVKEQFNIETQVAWEIDGENYDQKIALSIANGDIPDVMLVNRKLFNQLVENDLIQDMTEAYESCISPFLKEQYDTFGDRLFSEVSVDGKIMGIPSVSYHGGHNVLWIRQDWLDAVGGEVPTTLDEVVELARVFMEKDPGGNGAGKTIGLTANPDVYSGYSNRMGLDTVFSSMGAYPGWWVMKDGTPTYGSVAPEMKPVLQLLSELYAEGVLDKEFALRKGEDMDALLASGRLGMHFGVWWPAGGVTSAFENDPDAEWTAVSAPVNADGKLAIPENDPVSQIIVVRKGYEHPEAIIKALNGGYDIMRGNGEAGAEAYAQYKDELPPWNALPIAIDITYDDALTRIYQDFENALETGDASVMVTPGYTGAFESVQRYLENPNQDWADVQTYQARIIGTGAAVADNIERVPVAFYGQTATMDSKWSALTKLETETLVQIIMGEKPLDYFDEFVAQWYSLGGQEIVDEIIAYREERGMN